MFSKIVLAAIQDEGQRSMTPAGYKALLTLGAKGPMKKDYRGSFALIGFSGNPKPGFIRQVSHRWITLSSRELIYLKHCKTLKRIISKPRNQGILEFIL